MLEVVFPTPRRPIACPGGSYKKIGYYDSTKDDLSWSKTDKWIGKCSCACFPPIPLNSREQRHALEGRWVAGAMRLKCVGGWTRIG